MKNKTITKKHLTIIHSYILLFCLLFSTFFILSIKASANISYRDEVLTISDKYVNFLNVDKDIRKSTTRIILTDEVESISGWFSYELVKGAVKLESVSIGANVKTIESNPFAGCNNLEEIAVDERNTTFFSSGNCLIEKNSKTLISGCKNSIIPSDNSVSVIGNSAFKHCADSGGAGGLTSITIPQGITRIGVEAFSECSKLESVSIPNTVRDIGDNAFYRCNNLKDVSIPVGVISIGGRAFCECGSLSELSIPNSVKSIGYEAFYHTGLKTITIPGSVECISAGAFDRCYSLTEITLNKGIQEIGNAWGDETSVVLEKINYTGSVADWCNIVFKYPDSNPISFVHSIYIKGSKLTKITKSDLQGITKINDYAFLFCDGLVSVDIPENVTNIGAGAFSGCAVSSITIGNNVKKIGDGAFYNCSNLSSISLPNNDISIGEEAFYGTSYYKNSNNWFDNVLYIGNHLIKVEKTKENECLVNPETISIAAGAFSGCSKLTSIVLPSNLKRIEHDTFNGCTQLAEIIIPISVTNIGDCAFYKCTKLTIINIPNNVTNIGCGAFSICPELTTINIPNSVINIGAKAFYGCNGLKNITMPDNITSIENEIFYGCTGLTSFTIPNSVTSIGACAFEGCAGLTNVTIPNSVTSIGGEAFESCVNLTEISIPENVTQIGRCAFCGCTGLETINYNAICCKTVENVNVYNNDAWFYGDSNIKTIIIGEQVETIPQYAFYNCAGISIVYVSNSVLSIEKNAFGACNSITDVYYYGSAQGFEEKVSNIGNRKLLNAQRHFCTEEPEKEPSCVSPGLSSYLYWSNTNPVEYITSPIIIPATDIHTPRSAQKENELKATCTEGGHFDSVVYCGVCGDELSRETIETQPKGHSYTEVVTAPTCTEPGYTTYTCLCGDTYTDNEVAALGHSFTNYVYNNDATTEKDGTKTAKCDRCDATDTVTASGTKLTPETPVNPTANAKINVAGTKSVDYRTKVNIKATATNLDPAYHLVLVINGTEYEGNNREVSHNCGEISGDISYFVKIVDASGTVQKDANGAELKKDGGKITCNAGFFKKLIAFFKGLFGSLPSVEIKP